MVGLLAESDRQGPVTTNMSRVETPLLLTPDGTAAIVTLLDWRRTDLKEPCPSPCTNAVEYVETVAVLPFKSVTSVAVVVNGVLVALPFEHLRRGPGSHVSVGARVKFTVPVLYAAVVQLKGEPAG